MNAESVPILDAKKWMLLATLAEYIFTHATILTYFADSELNQAISKFHFFRCSSCSLSLEMAWISK